MIPNTKLSDQELLEELKIRFEQNRKALDELKELNKELMQVNKKLEESEALKSHFISNISNEIINPFSSILALSKAILSVDKENWKKVISMVALIHAEAFNLDFQLRNIFIAAKIEAGEITPEIYTVDIQNLIESLLEAFRFEFRKKRVKTSFTIEDESDGKPHKLFKTDPEKLKIVIANLLSNAVKYSFEGGSIEIKAIRCTDCLLVSVKDYGMGISKENHEIIFDRYRRVDNGINSINRGHGLGLSINKAIIDMLDGKISIESELGKGSCFTIIIPESTEEAGGMAYDDNESFFTDEASGSAEIF